MAKVTILSGVPGSGKSTMAISQPDPRVICSADDAFWVEEESGPVWRWNPDLIGEAHARCMRKFVRMVCATDFGALVPFPYDIIVDNTNTSVAEIAPYASLALSYGFTLEIVTIICDPMVAAARNVHGVPEERVVSMATALLSRQLPPWWPQRTVHV